MQSTPPRNSDTSQFTLVEQLIHRLGPGRSATSESAIPSLDELAQEFGLSPGHLQRTFKWFAGISPLQFSHWLDRNHAIQAMRQGQSLLSTTLELGYSSTANLHNLMIKLEAMSPGEIRNQGRGQTITLGHAPTPLGMLLCASTSIGLHRLEFETNSLNRDLFESRLKAEWPAANWAYSDDLAQQLAIHLFNDSAQANPATPLSLHLKASAFQLKVWEALIHLPSGQLTSYAGLARALGLPKASRAVGTAVANNPIAVLIPCHRVIQSTGQWGQYRWQPYRKQALHVWEQSHSPELKPFKTDLR